jgi:hypothetical protein
MAYESTTFNPETTSAEDMKQQAETMVERAKVRSTEAVQDTMDLVRRHPGKTLAVSLVAGIALGAIIVNALSEDEPETRLGQLAELGTDAWESVSAKAADALCVARDAVDAALARFR